MEFAGIAGFMNKNLAELKKLEDLVAHHEKTKEGAAVIPQARIDTLKLYVTTMKTACEVGRDLANHYSPSKAVERPKPTDEPTDGQALAKEVAAKYNAQKRAKKEEPTIRVPEAVEEAVDDLSFLD